MYVCVCVWGGGGGGGGGVVVCVPKCPIIQSEALPTVIRIGFIKTFHISI